MKNIKIFSLLFVCMSGISSDQLPLSYQESVKKIEQEFHGVIDALFSQTREAIIAKEEILTPELLARKEIKEIQHLVSDACISLIFDHNAENVIPGLMETYIETKIRDEMKILLAVEGVSVRRIDDFLDVSKIICAFSQGSDCRGMMRAIKDENFVAMQNLKVQKKVRQREKKERVRQLCERIRLGALPRQY